MKIMIFIPSLQFGGAERVTSILANTFCLHDDITIVTEARKEKEYLLDERVKRINLSSSSKIKNIFGIRKIAKSVRPDLCIIMFAPQYSYIYIALYGLHINQIVSERNDPVNFSGHKINKFLYQKALKKADGIVFQTTDALKYYYPNGNKKCTVIPNPIVLNSLPNKFCGNRSKRVVNVGRLHEQKNQAMLIRAFSKVHEKIPDYSLEIYGEGPLRNKLQDLIHNLKADNYIFLRGTTNNLFNKILDSSLFVLSSDYEGMPNALIEALCLGIPCISTDCPCGGPKELIKQNINGRLVPVGDENILASSIIEILLNEKIRQEFSEKGYLTRIKLDHNNVEKKWNDFCTSILYS